MKYHRVLYKIRYPSTTMHAVYWHDGDVFISISKPEATEVFRSGVLPPADERKGRFYEAGNGGAADTRRRLEEFHKGYAAGKTAGVELVDKIGFVSNEEPEEEEKKPVAWEDEPGFIKLPDELKYIKRDCVPIACKGERTDQAAVQRMDFIDAMLENHEEKIHQWVARNHKWPWEHELDIRWVRGDDYVYRFRCRFIPTK
jgi:hypothetical protein